MLGAKRGGLEQAAIDYAEALQQAGMAHRSIVPPDSWAAQQLQQKKLPRSTLAQRSAWDLFAALKLRRMLRGADAVLCHGNRALALALRAHPNAKIIAVAHNDRTRRFARADVAFAVTRAGQQQLMADGLDAARVHLVPNMVRVGALPPRPAFRAPPIIGALGRLHPVKGLDILIEALALLKQQGVAFRAIIAGDGEEETNLRTQIVKHGLKGQIILPGWIDNKAAFFESIDLYVQPSRSEAFGIGLCEAMAAGVPVIASATTGPSEIIRNDSDGLLCPIGDAAELAKHLRHLIDSPTEAQAMGARGHARVAADFSQDALAARLQALIPAILTGN